MSRPSKMARPNRSTPARRSKWREPEWVKLPEEKLLELRFCDLGLEIEGTDLEQRIAHLDRLLAGVPCWWLEVRDGAPEEGIMMLRELMGAAREAAG